MSMIVIRIIIFLSGAVLRNVYSVFVLVATRACVMCVHMDLVCRPAVYVEGAVALWRPQSMYCQMVEYTTFYLLVSVAIRYLIADFTRYMYLFISLVIISVCVTFISIL